MTDKLQVGQQFVSVSARQFDRECGHAVDGGERDRVAGIFDVSRDCVRAGADSDAVVALSL